MYGTAEPPFLPNWPKTRTKKKRGASSEFKVHKAVAEYLERFKRPGVLWFTINNNPRGKINGALNKMLGARAGVPDIIIGFQGKTYCLELKNEEGRWSDSQQIFSNEAVIAGWRYSVAWGFDQAKIILDGWEVTRANRRVR